MCCRKLNLARNAAFTETTRTQHDMSLQGLDGDNRLKHACRTHRVAIVSLEPINRHMIQSCPLNGNRLHLVVEHGRCAMGIDKCQTFACFGGMDRLESAEGPLAILGRRTDMESVIAYGACLNGYSIGLRGLFALQHNGCCRLAQVQS